MQTKVLENILVDVSQRRILLRSGYSGRAAVRDEDKKLVEKTFPKMLAAFSPKIVSGELDVTRRSSEEFVLGGDFYIHSISFSRAMSVSSRMTIYAATIGAGVEDNAARCADTGRYRESLMWDSFGSEAAEALARHLSGIIECRAKNAQLKTTARFSPGYGDLKLEINRMLLELLDANRIGINANREGLLLPRKSTTGFIGWIPSSGKL